MNFRQEASFSSPPSKKRFLFPIRSTESALGPFVPSFLVYRTFPLSYQISCCSLRLKSIQNRITRGSSKGSCALLKVLRAQKCETLFTVLTEIVTSSGTISCSWSFYHHGTDEGLSPILFPRSSRGYWNSNNHRLKAEFLVKKFLDNEQFAIIPVWKQQLDFKRRKQPSPL